MTELFVAVNAKYPHTNPAVRLLSAEVEKTGLASGFIEHTVNTKPDDVLFNILSFAPRVAAFSCYIWNIAYILNIAEALKIRRPDIQILLGGPEVSFDAEALLSEYPFIDLVIRGEGERAHCDFALVLLGKKTLSDCASLTYRDGGKIISNPIGIEDEFETASFPYPDLDRLKNRVIYYEASRGCPFACAFCLSSEYGGCREKPLDVVKRDIMRFIDAESKIVKFVDRTFNANRSRAIDILKFIMANSKRTCFHLELAPSLLSDPLLACLSKAKPGIFQLEIGIQSTNAPTLAAVNRRDDFASFAPKIRRLAGFHNMHIHVDLIAGLPFEGISEFKKSFDDVFSLFADNVQLGFLKLLKGAPLRAQAETYGIRYEENAPYTVIETPWLSGGDITLLEEIEYLIKRFYASGLFKHTVLLLADHIGSAFAVFERLNARVKREPADIKKASEFWLVEMLWRFCESADAGAAKEMLLFEAMSKNKRPRLPAPMLTQAHRDFRRQYFKENHIPQTLQKPLYPLRFSFDILAYLKAFRYIRKPTVLVFDYSDFPHGAIIREG